MYKLHAIHALRCAGWEYRHATGVLAKFRVEPESASRSSVGGQVNGPGIGSIWKTVGKKTTDMKTFRVC